MLALPLGVEGSEGILNNVLNKVKLTFSIVLLYIFNMLELLIKSPTRRKILGLFIFNQDHELYPGQVANEIDESPSVVGLELAALAKGGLLAQRKEGRRIYYKSSCTLSWISPLREILERMRDEGDQELRGIPDLTRRREIERNLQQVLEGLKKYYDPDKVILFGSAATGKVGPYSDIDLVVIKETDLPFMKRSLQLVDLLDYDISIDFLVYTPDEFASAVRERRFFQDEILKKGKVLYEKQAA